MEKLSASDRWRDMKDDGDVIDIGGGRSLRLRLEVDEGYSINDYDSDGKVAWGRKGQYDDREQRPEGFDGSAEKLGIYDHGVSLWWQPMKGLSIKRGTPEWRAERSRIRDLAEYGFKVVILELLEGEDAYGRPIVIKSEATGGCDSVYPELLDDLASEMGL